MKDKMKKRAMLLLPLVVGVILWFFLTSVSNLETGYQAKGKAELEDALRRAAVACYAAEGIYPPNLEYIEERYGIRIDKEKYTVVYEVVGSNFMPEITVLKTNDEE